MKRLLVIFGILFGTLALGGTSLGAGLAFASGPTTNTTIGQGNNGDPIGTASLTRSLLGDGSETIDLSLALTAAGATIDQVHVCVSSNPFTQRIPPGQCAFVFENLSDTTFDTVINIGNTHVGESVCFQIHLKVIYNGDPEAAQTAYAEWQSGRPFYGNLCIPADSVPVPIGAIGAVGAAGVAGVGFVVWQARRRRAIV